MDKQLISQLHAAKDVLAQKEALEMQIHEEKRKVNAHKLHLQALESKMDTKSANRRDKGRRIGTFFGILAAAVLVICTVLIVWFHAAGKNPDYAAGVFLLGIYFFVPAAIVSIVLFSAYARGRTKRADEAQKAKGEYEAYLRDVAAPTEKECEARVAELNRQIDALMRDNGEKLAFLPQSHRHIAAVNHMLNKMEQGSADSIDQAVQLCDDEKINEVYQNEITRREEALSVSGELKLKLAEAKKVFVRKEELETLIFEENLKIHAHKIHLQMLESKMDLDEINRRDRGLRLGRRFGIIAGIILTFGLIAMLSGAAEGDGTFLMLTLCFGGPPTVASVCLLSAYFRGKKVRAIEAEKVAREHKAFLENKAKPVTQQAGMRIKELKEQINELRKASAETLAFLPQKYWNVGAVSHMIGSISGGHANSLDQAMALCDKERINNRYYDKIRRREKELAQNYVEPSNRSGGGGGIVGWMILDGILDSIFGK